MKDAEGHDHIGTMSLKILKSIVCLLQSHQPNSMVVVLSDTHPLSYQVFDRLVEVDGKGGSKMDLCDRLSLQKETPPVRRVR